MRSTPARTAVACVLTLAASVVLAACTSSSSNAQPGPAPTTTPVAGTASGRAPSGGGSYSSSADVINALKAAGRPCRPVSGSADTNLKAPGLRSVSACAITSSGSAASGGAVTATVFDSHTDAQAYAAVLTSAQASGLLLGGTSERAVVGRNWVVLVPGDPAYAEQVSAALGGSVVGGSTGSAG